MVVDTLIKNAKIVSPEIVTEGHIAIEKGKVVGIITDASFPDANEKARTNNKGIITGM